MDAFVMNFCWVLLVAIIFGALRRVSSELWLKPRRIRSKLSKQGIGGPPHTSLLLGNIGEMKKIQSMVKKPSFDAHPKVSHSWYHSTFPFLQKWCQEYGQVYMYATGNKLHMYIGQPELMKELNLHKSLDLGRPTYLNTVTEPMFGDGIIRANGEHWSFQRKLIAPQFFLHKVKDMMGLMEESTIAMVETWKRQIAGSEGGFADIMVDQDMKSISADIISRACFGSSYSQGKQMFAKLGLIQEAVSAPSLLFGLPIFRFIPTKKNRKLRRLKKEVEELILKLVKSRREESQRGGISEKDLLQMILENAEAENLQHPGKTDRFIVDMCKNIYFAGHETTALASSWTLMLLALYPEWQDRVRAEIFDVCGDSLHQHHLDLDKIRQLKTLSMVIQESLRLYGPGVIIIREAFAEMKLGDLVAPKGVHMWHLIPLLHRDPENWGSDAEEFKPERFANGISEACKYPQAYIPFGYGSRLCLGQTFGMLELKIMLVHLLSRFSFQLSPKYQHSPVYRMLLVPEHGIRLLVRRVRGSMG